MPALAACSDPGRPGRDRRARRRATPMAGLVKSMFVADVAVISGTGFYSFLDDPEEARRRVRRIGTVAVGTVAGRKVAFCRQLPRRPFHLTRSLSGEPGRCAFLGVSRCSRLRGHGRAAVRGRARQLVVPDGSLTRTCTGIRSSSKPAPWLRSATPAVRPAVRDVRGRPGYRDRGSDGRHGAALLARAGRASASEGWTLIDISGEAEGGALARGMRQCSPRSRSSSAWTRPERRGGQPGACTLRGRRLSRLTGILSRRAVERCRTPTVAPARRGPTASTSPTRCPDGGGLLTGSAGYVGQAIGTALGRRHRGRPSRPDDADGARLVRRAGGHLAGKRPGIPARWPHLLEGVNAVFHRRVVARASRSATCPTTPRSGLAPPSCSPPCRHRSTGWCSRPRWSCTARVATPAPSTASRLAAAHRAPRRGDRAPTARLGAVVDLALVGEHARLDPRSSYAASKVAQAHYTSAWVRQADVRRRARRSDNVYRPGTPRTRLLRRRGDVSVLAGAR